MDYDSPGASDHLDETLGLHLLAHARPSLTCQLSAHLSCIWQRRHKIVSDSHSSLVAIQRVLSLWRSLGSLCLAWTPAWSTLLEQNTSWACRPNFTNFHSTMQVCQARRMARAVTCCGCDQVRIHSRSPPFVGHHSMLRRSSDFASFVRASLQDLSRP